MIHNEQISIRMASTESFPSFFEIEFFYRLEKCYHFFMILAAMFGVAGKGVIDWLEIIL